MMWSEAILMVTKNVELSNKSKKKVIKKVIKNNNIIKNEQIKVIK